MAKEDQADHLQLSEQSEVLMLRYSVYGPKQSGFDKVGGHGIETNN